MSVLRGWLDVVIEVEAVARVVKEFHLGQAGQVCSIGVRDCRDVVIAWFTVKEQLGRALVAFSRDAGRTFGTPVRIDEAGSLGRVDVELLADGSALATWIEFAAGPSGDQRAQFRARIIEPSGRLSPSVTIAGIEGSRTSGYPRVARDGDELLFAWTENVDGRLRVRTARALSATSGASRSGRPQP